MAVGRNTIVTFYTKGESNSCIAKKLHIRLKLFGRWLKSLRKLMKHATGQARAENEQSEQASGEKYEVTVEKEFTLFCPKNGCRSRNQSNFNASNP